MKYYLLENRFKYKDENLIYLGFYAYEYSSSIIYYYHLVEHNYYKYPFNKNNNINIPVSLSDKLKSFKNYLPEKIKDCFEFIEQKQNHDNDLIDLTSEDLMYMRLLDWIE